MKGDGFLKGTLKLTLLSLVCLLAFSSNKRAGLEISVISPMEKTFPDIFPTGAAPRVLSFKCAANEYEPAQFVIRSPKAIQGVTIALSELVSKDGHKLQDIHWNFVGFIPLDSNTPDTTRADRCGCHDRVPEGEIIRLAPCKISDPLLEDEVVDLEADVYKRQTKALYPLLAGIHSCTIQIPLRGQVKGERPRLTTRQTRARKRHRWFLYPGHVFWQSARVSSNRQETTNEPIFSAMSFSAKLSVSLSFSDK